MLTLGIDSSGKVSSCALLEDGMIIGEYSTNIGLTHSETLLPMISEMLLTCRKETKDLDLVAVSAGPGSFTGLRIGVATSKGIALAHHIPMVSVSTLEGLSHNVIESDYYIHPIMDARREQVYTATFYEGKLVGIEEAISIDVLIDRINHLGGKHLFLGDGVPVYRELIDELMKTTYRYADPVNLMQRASSIAIIGEKKFLKGDYISGRDFSISYIRKPQAEREREAKGLRDFDIIHKDSEDMIQAHTEDRLTPSNYIIEK